MPAYSGSPASSTTTLSSAGCPNSSTSPLTTPYVGSSPLVNLAIRTDPSLASGSGTPLIRPALPHPRLIRVNDVLEQGAEGASFRDEDWYAEDIGPVRFVD